MSTAQSWGCWQVQTVSGHRKLLLIDAPFDHVQKIYIYDKDYIDLASIISGNSWTIVSLLMNP